MEIGGTSRDVMVMAQGEVPVTDELTIDGYHLTTPSVEIHTVGAGGGTIAWVDEAGLLHVGPQGAGARPGPAAYGLGGENPTVTDAQLVLGRLRPGRWPAAPSRWTERWRAKPSRPSWPSRSASRSRMPRPA